jgi:hypothetical protein
MTDELRDQPPALILRRVYGEFLEMPGLRLTARQAQRLWSLDEGTCRKVLNFLVDAKFLRLTARGAYARAAEGRVLDPCPRMARAAKSDPAVSQANGANRKG